MGHWYRVHKVLLSQCEYSDKEKEERNGVKALRIRNKIEAQVQMVWRWHKSMHSITLTIYAAAFTTTEQNDIEKWFLWLQNIHIVIYYFDIVVGIAAVSIGLPSCNEHWCSSPISALMLCYSAASQFYDRKFIFKIFQYNLRAAFDYYSSPERQCNYQVDSLLHSDIHQLARLFPVCHRVHCLIDYFFPLDEMFILSAHLERCTSTP